MIESVITLTVRVKGSVHETTDVSSLPVPYFIKAKAWDVVIMMTFLMTIGTGRLLTSVVS